MPCENYLPCLMQLLGYFGAVASRSIVASRLFNSEPLLLFPVDQKCISSLRILKIVGF